MIWILLKWLAIFALGFYALALGSHFLNIWWEKIQTRENRRLAKQIKIKKKIKGGNNMSIKHKLKKIIFKKA